MASMTWLGRAGEVPEVKTYTVGGAVTAGNTFSITINTKTVTYTTVTGDTTTTAAAGLAAALTDSEYGEFGEITWESALAVVTGTGPADGANFTVTTGTSGSGSPTLTAATVTAGTGPHHWNNVNNWSAGSAPVTGDTVTIGGGLSIKYDLDQSAVTLAALHATQGFPANEGIGLPDRNANGYAEYRKVRLQISATLCVLDTQSSQIRLDFGTNAAALTVHDSGRASDGAFAVDVVATHASTTVVVNRGQVGVAAVGIPASTVASVRTAFRDRQDSDAAVTLGPGLIITTVEQTGGDLVLRCAATTVTHEGGTLTRFGTGAVTTFDNRGGTVDDYGTGTITTLNNGARWTRRGLAALTVTDANLYADGETNDRSGVVVWTNAPQYIKCGPPSAPGDSENQPPAVHHFNFGYGRKITIADV